MYYKCKECGHIFEEGEQAEWHAYGGEMRDDDIACGCPLCHGGYQTMQVCSVCDELFVAEETEYGEARVRGRERYCCPDCIDRFRFDYKAVKEIADLYPHKDKIEINSFLAGEFTPKEIEDVLMKRLEESNRIKPVDCGEFINADRSYFGDYAVVYNFGEEVRNGENKK